MARYRPIPLAILACALLPLSMLGGTAARDSLDEQLDIMAESNGLSRVSHLLYRDWLSEGSHQLVGFDLESNTRYTLLGACDPDCSDLDFEFLRPDGATMRRSIAAGGRPVLHVETTRDGKYQLRAIMQRCRLQPCEWGARVYRR